MTLELDGNAKHGSSFHSENRASIQVASLTVLGSLIGMNASRLKDTNETTAYVIGTIVFVFFFNAAVNFMIQLFEKEKQVFGTIVFAAMLIPISVSMKLFDYLLVNRSVAMGLLLGWLFLSYFYGLDALHQAKRSNANSIRGRAVQND